MLTSRGALAGGAVERVGAVALAGGDIGANGSATFILTVAPNTSHTYGIQAAFSGGHTAGVLAAEASIVVIDL